MGRSTRNFNVRSSQVRNKGKNGFNVLSFSPLLLQVFNFPLFNSLTKNYYFR